MKRKNYTYGIPYVVIVLFVLICFQICIIFSFYLTAWRWLLSGGPKHLAKQISNSHTKIVEIDGSKFAFKLDSLIVN
jgi:hypothetical protein